MLKRKLASATPFLFIALFAWLFVTLISSEQKIEATQMTNANLVRYHKTYQELLDRADTQVKILQRLTPEERADSVMVERREIFSACLKYQLSVVRDGYNSLARNRQPQELMRLGLPIIIGVPDTLRLVATISAPS